MSIPFKSLLVALSILPMNAFAGQESGRVKFQHGQFASSSTSAGFTFFFLEGSTKTDNPPCSKIAGGERWVINNDSPAAKIQTSILLAAITAGKTVLVRGTGDCGVWGDTETAQDIMITN